MSQNKSTKTKLREAKGAAKISSKFDTKTPKDDKLQY